MQVVQTAEQLFENDSDDVFVEMGPYFDEVDDRSTAAQFGDHLEVVLALEHLVQLDYVGMVQLLEQLQLSKHLLHLRTDDRVLPDHLHCALFVSQQTDCLVHAAKGTSSNFILETVILCYAFFP